MRIALRDRAQGRWRGILPQLGVPETFLNGKHQPCPICGGKDRARFDDKDGRGTWICTRCGAGDGISLVMAVNGWNFSHTAQCLERLFGTVERVEPCRPIPEQTRRDALNRLWRSSRPVQSGDPVALWLNSRVGLTEIPPCLRTAARMRYHDDQPSWHPGMVAMVTGPDGTPSTLHRTYLTADGRKAEVEKPRLLMPGPFPKGGAIKLASYGEVLGIAEGIETAFAASALFGMPCWAAVCDTALAAWLPPEDVAQIIIFADNDQNFAGQAAAYRLAHRLAVNDRVVRVESPSTSGWDWNDVLWQEWGVTRSSPFPEERGSSFCATDEPHQVFSTPCERPQPLEIANATPRSNPKQHQKRKGRNHVVATTY